MSDPNGTPAPVHIEPAPAKLNLTLRVLGRRDDGYHEISSLVAFAGLGERLSFRSAETTSIEVVGPEANSLVGTDNLVLAADRAFRQRFAGQLGEMAYKLDKHIPVAAGLGGGSADAAAVLRGLAKLAGLDAASPDLHQIALALGADVPVCLNSRAAQMTGIGETVCNLGLAPTFTALLVNPRIKVSTADVFAALGLKRGAMPATIDHTSPPVTPHELQAAIVAGGNDLEAAAQALVPEITNILQYLREMSECQASRMSGSGATCFGLYGSFDAARRAEAQIAAERPDWWSRAVRLV